MRGIVLAAGGGTRLRPLTDDLPKTLLPVEGDRTMLELAVANLAEVDVRQVVIVTGHASAAIEAIVPRLGTKYDVDIEIRFNERYATANNAVSLWEARDRLGDGALLVNGDTVHPVSVERKLLAARGTSPLLLAVDDVKRLGAEEMKVTVDDRGAVTRISKQLDPTAASGEYIGVSLIDGDAADELVAALERTFQTDPARWYEDGFQEYVDHGGEILAVSIGTVEWGEVDDHDDLAYVRSLLCRS